MWLEREHRGGFGWWAALSPAISGQAFLVSSLHQQLQTSAHNTILCRYTFSSLGNADKAKEYCLISPKAGGTIRWQTFCRNLFEARPDLSPKGTGGGIVPSPRAGGLWGPPRPSPQPGDSCKGHSSRKSQEQPRECSKSVWRGDETMK